MKYVKAGATATDLEADRVDCRSQILMSATGPVIPSGQMGKPGASKGMGTATPTQVSCREDSSAIGLSL
ncbi:MAG: hypothetical protein NPIRA06_24610 [Nitrospirales bacterium]|nr:MAG: hypothetical protein NPIRA06_24610 [Nitrospirales bacterium]